MEAVLPTGENRLLAMLSPPALALLVPHLRTCPLTQGATLQEAESPVERVYFPQSGLISLVARMQTGEIVDTAAVGREGAIGAFAGLGPWNAFTRAVVQVSGRAVFISASPFQVAVSHNQEIKELVLRYKEALLSQVQQLAACNALHTLEARLARWLLQAHDASDGVILSLTQEALGQMLGVRRTTVTLVAQQIQSLGLVRYRRGRIEILDRGKLEGMACECYMTIRRRSEAVTALKRSTRNLQLFTS